MAWEEDLDACSILVPAVVIDNGGIGSIRGAFQELPEDPHPPWDGLKTYAAGERVFLTNTHRVYESAKAGNLGKTPADPANQYNAGGVATWWIDIGPSNRYAMFDSMVSTQTLSPSPLTISLTPGAFNGFALFGVDADAFSVVVKDAPGGNIIFSEYGTDLDATAPEDYYEYFFERFKPLRQFIRAGIEPYGSAEITIDLFKATGQIGVGMVAVGDLRPIGIPQRNATVEPQDFSYFKQDAFGNTTVKKRNNATSMNISAIVEPDAANSVLDTVKEVLGTPVVVVGSQARSYEWLTVFGLISGRMDPNPFPYSTLNLTVKGLI